MTQEKIIYIPDLGGASHAEVIEVLVTVGDKIEKNASLLTLESDKASMEIPCPYPGEVLSMSVKVGDKVSQGTAILTLKVEEDALALSQPESDEPPQAPEIPPQVQTEVPKAAEQQAKSLPEKDGMYAGPSVRRLARELEINLTVVKGTGPKSRITREDLLSFIKSRLQGGGASFEAVPEIDFSQFGPIDTQPLNKIKKLTAEHMRRSWLNVPHVTQFDEVDITELEAFRQKESIAATEQGYKLTLLAFIVKAIAKVLAQFPQFNASLNAAGDALIYKKYCHIGIAVDTPQGLVVPVIKQADTLSVGDIAREMQRLSGLAREKKLKPSDMQGGCFSISSLGGIGGGVFTPIVNAPEVAILGVSRAVMKPVYIEGALVPRLMLPLALSYDHRVIDGAEGARFMKELNGLLSDVCRILL